MDANTPLKGLVNIGPTIARRLASVGIHTVGDLQRIGPAAAFRRVQAANSQATTSVCYYLYSLQGALEGRHWDALPEAVKRRLQQEAGLT